MSRYNFQQPDTILGDELKDANTSVESSILALNRGAHNILWFPTRLGPILPLPRSFDELTDI